MSLLHLNEFPNFKILILFTRMTATTYIIVNAEWGNIRGFKHPL